MNAWFEMIRHYLAMAIGALIIALLVSAWRKRWKSGHRKTALVVIHDGVAALLALLLITLNYKIRIAAKVT